MVIYNKPGSNKIYFIQRLDDFHETQVEQKIPIKFWGILT